jgi:hypothetical protein
MAPVQRRPVLVDPLDSTKRYLLLEWYVDVVIILLTKSVYYCVS